MDNNDEVEDKKLYRQYLRPGYKRSMVSSQTHNTLKRRCTLDPSIPNPNNQDREAEDDSDSDSSDYQETDLESLAPRTETSQESSIEDLSSSSSGSEQELEDFVLEDENRPEFQDARHNNKEIAEVNQDNFNADVNNGDLNNQAGNDDTDHSSADDEGPETRYHWENLIFFPQSQITVRDAIAMVRGFSLRFGLSLEARSALINLLKICAGPDFDNLNLTNYKIARMFDSGEDKLTFSFYCPACKQILLSTNKKKTTNPEGLCDKCGSRCNLSTQKGKYILMVDLKYQIERMFEVKAVKTELVKLYRGQTRRPAAENSITDFQDGNLYKRLNPTNSKSILTLNFFFDGAIMKRSGSEHFWSALIQVNEIPISLRMKYIILAEVMMIAKEPKPDLMDSFINELIKQIEQLNKEGIRFQADDVDIIFTFKIFFGISDSVARPILQSRVQYNGFFGCSWCYQRGTYINIVKYLFDPDFRLRTHESHLEDVRNVQLRKEDVNIRQIRDTFVNGVKGPSSLLNLTQFFDIVCSFPLEYMHCILIGVVHHLWESWIKKGLLSAQNVQDISQNLISLETVHENHRIRREFSTKCKWKASEWRSWLLFFGVPVMRDYLPQNFLEHFALLVNTVFILLKMQITEDELLVCESNMIQFVGEFEILIGSSAMTFNVHILLHLVESVRNSGPLWVTSAFSFESHLHVLKQYVLGPKKPDQQMATKSLDILHYKFECCRKIFHSEVARQYCKRIFSPTPLSTFRIRTPYGVTFFGKSLRIQIRNPTNNEIIDGESFQKCIYRGCVYKSIKNTLSSKRNDTVFQLNSNEIIQIHDIIKTDAICYLSVVQIAVVPDELINHLFKITEKGANTTLIPISRVQEKLIHINCKNSSYVCRLPQTIEIQ